MYCRYCCNTELLAQIVKIIYPFQRGAASEWYVLLSIYFLLSVICWLKSKDCNRWVCTQGARVNSVILSFHLSVRVVDIIIFWKQLCFLVDLLRKDKSWIEISLHLHFFYVKPRLIEIGRMNLFDFFKTTDRLRYSSNSWGPLILPEFWASEELLIHIKIIMYYLFRQFLWLKFEAVVNWW